MPSRTAPLCSGAAAALLIASTAAAGGPPAEPTPAFGSPAALETWARALQDQDPTSRDRELRRVDPKYDPSILAAEVTGDGSPLPFVAAKLFRGQLDADAAPELVAQVRFHEAELRGAGEREEVYWIGIFDEAPDGVRLVGHRPVERFGEGRGDPGAQRACATTLLGGPHQGPGRAAPLTPSRLS